MKKLFLLFVSLLGSSPLIAGPGAQWDQAMQNCLALTLQKTQRNPALQARLKELEDEEQKLEVELQQLTGNSNASFKQATTPDSWLIYPNHLSAHSYVALPPQLKIPVYYDKNSKGIACAYLNHIRINDNFKQIDNKQVKQAVLLHELGHIVYRDGLTSKWLEELLAGVPTKQAAAAFTIKVNKFQEQRADFFCALHGATYATKLAVYFNNKKDKIVDCGVDHAYATHTTHPTNFERFYQLIKIALEMDNTVILPVLKFNDQDYQWLFNKVDQRDDKAQVNQFNTWLKETRLISQALCFLHPEQREQGKIAAAAIPIDALRLIKPSSQPRLTYLEIGDDGELIQEARISLQEQLLKKIEYLRTLIPELACNDPAVQKQNPFPQEQVAQPPAAVQPQHDAHLPPPPPPIHKDQASDNIISILCKKNPYPQEKAAQQPAAIQQEQQQAPSPLPQSTVITQKSVPKAPTHQTNDQSKKDGDTDDQQKLQLPAIFRRANNAAPTTPEHWAASPTGPSHQPQPTSWFTHAKNFFWSNTWRKGFTLLTLAGSILGGFLLWQSNNSPTAPQVAQG